MKVIVDKRESEKITNYLEKMEVEVEKKQLEIGDFVLPEEIAIERKTLKDFSNSILDGRIFRQMKNICAYKNPILILEGSEFETNLNLNAIKSAILSIAIGFRVPIIWTRNEIETAEYVYLLLKRQLKKKRPFLIKKKKRTSSLKETQENVVSSIPSIGPSLARNLLNEFKSIRNVFNAGEEELKKVKKLGEKKARIIKRIVNCEY